MTKFDMKRERVKIKRRKHTKGKSKKYGKSWKNILAHEHHTDHHLACASAVNVTGICVVCFVVCFKTTSTIFNLIFSLLLLNDSHCIPLQYFLFILNIFCAK